MLTLYDLLGLLPSGFVPTFTPRLNDLCLFLLEQEKMDEKQAAEKYLGSIERLKYFNKLKNELKRALIRYIIANPSWANNQHKALFEDCYKNFATYKILLLNNQRKAAIEIANMLLPKAQKLELHSLVQTIVNDLLFHYSSIEVSSGLMKKYESLAIEQQKIVQAESLARRYHSRVGYITNTRESFPQSIIEEFIHATEQVLPLLDLGSHHINRLVYSIVMCRYIVVYDYENVIKYCNEALNSFPKDHPNGRSFLFTFMYNKVSALLALGQLEEAKQIAKDAGKLVPKGFFNWHLALLNRIIVCLYAGDYQEAYELYKAHKQTPCNFAILEEYWKIIQGYLYFLVKQEHIEPYTDERFYLGKFLNEVPIYSKDKAGNNINILIIQILIQMQREQYGKIIDRTESLRVYAKKHARNPETKRANIFINMILKMESAHFHRLRTETKTEKLWERLQNTPLKIGQNLAIEIIPYEVLWKEMLSMLANKFRGKTVRRATRPTSKKNKT